MQSLLKRKISIVVTFILLIVPSSFSGLPLAYANNRVTVDFSTYPGPDGLLGTADDIAVNIGDAVSEQYAALGAHFSGLNFIDFCCEFDFTLGVLAISGPFSVKFDKAQSQVSFDAKGILISAGNALPVTLYGANDVAIASYNLTNADAIPPSLNNVLSGHFSLSSATPFSRIDFGATLPDNGGMFFDNLNFELPTPPAPVVKNINIDIKPQSYVNKINSTSNGVVPVAILTTADFDASSINPASVTFGPGKTAPVQSAMEDVNADGKLDLILHFDMQASAFVCATNNAVHLDGKTLSGQLVAGVDSVSDVACK